MRKGSESGKSEGRKTGQWLWHVLPWTLVLDTGHAQQAGPPSHTHLRSAAGQSPQTETSGSGGGWGWGVGQRLLHFKSKGYLEATALSFSLTGELGQGTHRKVNNCPDGLFFPLHEVVILQDKNTQGWNRSCVKTETQLDCSAICLINWLLITTLSEKVSIF